jgi:Spy/CpxP family protein refolding chaperone
MKYVAIPLIIGWFLGAACGLWFMHFWHSPHMHERHIHRMRDRFAKQLHLSPEQRDKVATVLKAKHEQMDALFARARADEEAIRLATRQQISALLDPDQQKKLVEINARMDARKKRFTFFGNERGSGGAG